MEVFFVIRRQKTTIYLDTKADATILDIKKMIAGIIKRPPEDQRLTWERQGWVPIEKCFHDEVRPAEPYPHHGRRVDAPIWLSLILRDEETGEFEELKIYPYSDPPPLRSPSPDVLDLS